jgi:hypothetical protein
VKGSTAEKTSIFQTLDPRKNYMQHCQHIWITASVAALYLLTACLPSYDIVDGQQQNAGGKNNTASNQPKTGGASNGSHAGGSAGERSGSTPSSGGASSSSGGATSSSGGTTATGGTLATGGTVSTGGMNSIGGRESTGGTKTTGGAVSTGGSTSSTGGNANSIVTPLFTFSSGLQGFTLEPTPDTLPYINLGAPGAGVVTISWSSKDYDGGAVAPNAGSLMITATFTNWNQHVAVEVPFPADNLGNPISLFDPTTGKFRTTKARVDVASGLSANLAQFPGGVVLYVKSMNYDWGQSTWQNIDSTGSWQTLSFDAAAPGTGSVATFISTGPMKTLGIQISSSVGGTVPPAFGTPLVTVIFIDQITIEDDP